MGKEMAVSIILAIALVAGAIVVADYSLETPTSTKRTPLPQHTYAFMQQSAATPAMARSPVPVPMHTSPVYHGISKCLLDGQTSYSNDGCPRGAITQRVALHDTAGIEDKSREQLAALRAASRPAAGHEARVIRHVNLQASATSADEANRKMQCADLKRQIEEVDARARQPQSARSQDHLRERKKKLRDRYSALRC